jgi:GNAT superfamily N-acetyltransferase
MDLVEATTILTNTGMVICYVRPSLSSGKKMFVEDLVIDHRHRQCGLGSLLMQRCIDMAKAEDLVEMVS